MGELVQNIDQEIEKRIKEYERFNAVRHRQIEKIELEIKALNATSWRLWKEIALDKMVIDDLKAKLQQKS